MKHFALFVAVMLAFAIAANAQSYKTRSITFPGAFPTTLVSMNRSGQVAGTASLTFLQGNRAFFWSKTSGIQNLGTLGGTSALVTAMNDSGRVVGYADLSGDATYHAFLWTASSGMQDLGSFGGLSAAHAINASGTVVGVSLFSPSNAYRAFLWTPSGGMQDLGFGDGSEAVSVNDLGEVIGQSCSLPCNAYHAVLWSSNRGVENLDVPGSLSTQPVAINNREEVIGSYKTAAGTFAFFWSRTAGFQTLPSLGGNNTTANFINSAGEVAGSSCFQFLRPCDSFVWTLAGGLQDLGTPPQFPFEDESFPVALNNNGEVLGGSVVRAPSKRNFLYFNWTPPTGQQEFKNLTGNHYFASGALNDAGQIAGQTGTNGYRVFVLSPIMRVTLTSSLNPSRKGQAVTFTATVTSVVGAPPNGEHITFKLGGKPLGTVALVGGTASLTTSTMSVGTHALVATYAGDVNYDPSSSTSLQQVVNP